jgi:predicted anti-sigma-YlaC factor YlaD
VRDRIGWNPGTRAAVCALALVLSTGCSLRRMAAERIGEALASGGAGWAADDDPRLVGDALPFALKTFESLLAETPEHAGLLLASCRGFASYAAGWVEAEAERIETEDFAAARGERERALRLHLRARGYCLRALELRHPGLGRELVRTDPARALARAARRDIELLYWTGGAWGSAVALGLERPELVADLPVVRALFARALELDRDWGEGALHEAMIPLAALSGLHGGSPERAREHYERAVELSGGRRAGPHVAYARSALVTAQDRAGFRETLERALAIDPDAAPGERLGNLLAQARARILLSRIDELFFDEGEE